MAEQHLTFVPIPDNPRFHDLTGRRFGRLEVLGFAGQVPDGRFGRLVSMWWCRCRCGNVCRVPHAQLTSGNTASCGCLYRDSRRSCTRTHGRSRSPEHRAWASVIQRCGNPSTDHYADYGGRGIRVCRRWLDSFEAFYADVGPRPSPAHTLDRHPNNNGDYEPGNVRWATREDQSRNRRNNVHLTFQGQTRCLAEWAEITGIPVGTIRSRIIARNWSVDRALTEPVHIQHRG